MVENPLDPSGERFDLEVLAAVLETAEALIIVTDVQGTVLRFNPACERLTGWSLDEVVGRDVRSLLVDDALHDAARTVLSRGGSARGEGRLRTRGGEDRTIAFTTTALHDGDGRPRFLVATGVDVTEERRAVAAVSASERRHRALVEHSSDLVVVVDAEGVVRYVSPSSGPLLGWSPSEIEGTSGWDLVAPADRTAVTGYLEETLDWPGPTIAREFRLIDREGREVLFEAVANNQLDDPAVNGIIMHLRDVSERRRLVDDVRAAEERFREVFAKSPNGIALVALDGRIVEANRAFAEIVGREMPELRTRPVQDITHPDDLDADLGYLRRLVAGEIPEYRMEKRYVRPDGTVVWAQLTVALLHDAEGAPAQLLAHVEDITARKTFTEELARQAHHDGLTGLANRRVVHRRIDEALARRHRHDVGVLFVDLDGFKGVNDTYGHDVGDALLATVAARLADVLRPTDLVGRVGGDEFVIVCEPASPSVIEAVCERVRAALRRPIEVEGVAPLTVGATIGAIVAADGEDTAAVLRRADEEMYRQKASRRPPSPV